ncbi:unnamed protein product [Rotaria sp. Silwood2]|nr:unnamed protein product [Rotaria sp. Silwood2]CAF2534621.1 unnamed protein product [Rotaria sp. Silwood2]CAF2762418.1 unnamed protein product [Rotaria sp. Silwood2]CAF2940005.1 unnamed protein product [Rotaria sp. Silwood2]CAF3850662.1 unnamed protein product [Rotaria sp. Silwood2]
MGGSEAAPPERKQWSNPVEFFLTLVAFAVGLGNVWRFPYLCFKNGGGAFLIPYTFMLIFIGAPVFYLELTLGQFTSAGPLVVWRVNPLLRGIGYASLATNCFLALYYNVLIAYCFYYLIASFQLVVPWSTCGNWWNTALCTDQRTLANMSRADLELIKNMTTSPSEEYFYRAVLQISNGVENLDGVVTHLAIALAVAWLICFLALSKGVQSLGKIAYFTALFPYVMLTVLIIRGATLSGAIEGVKFYMGTVNFSVLKNPSVWKEACTQVFYALSCCSGGLIAMSSFNDFNNNVYRDTISICLVTWFTSIFGGFAIFTVLGHMATKMGVSVADVAKGGPGLAFVVFPEGLSMMPFAPLWCVLFFLMMCTLGFGSEFSIMETVMASIIDEYKTYLNTPKKIIIFRFCISFVFFLLGLSMVTRGGLYVLNIIDQYLGGFPWLIIGVIELFCIAWVYGVDNFCDDIALMIGEKRRPSIFWKICWKYISPLILLFTIVFSSLFYQDVTLDDYIYPSWALALGWIVVIACLGWLPYIFLVEICRRGTWGIIKEARLPHARWGPAREEHRQLSKRYANKHDTKQLSMQTLSTIDTGDTFDLDAAAIEVITASPKLFVKRLSDVSTTRF